jgi:Flp pilus assembly protein CpaB
MELSLAEAVQRHGLEHNTCEGEMSVKLQRIMWFIAGNVVGLSALLVVMLWVKPAGFNQMGDMSAMQVTPADTAQPPESKSPLGAETVGVVVANRDLDRGTTLSKSDLKLETMPKDFSNENSFIDPTKLIGKKINQPLKTGDLLLDNMFVAGH